MGTCPMRLRLSPLLPETRGAGRSMAASVEKRPLTADYGLADLLARLRREVANWFAVAALLQLIWPSRLFPHPALHRSWVGRIRFTIRLRSGAVIRPPPGQ